MIPVCQALLAERHELPTWPVVVSFSRSLSAALALWRVGPPPRVDALVLDVTVVPAPRSLEEARKWPTAAILGAALHGYEGDVDAARVGIDVARELPEKKYRRYAATILAALPVTMRKTVMDELNIDDYEDELMEIERQSGTYHVGLQAGLEQGLEQGFARGRLMTLIEHVLVVLELRGVAVDPASAARIRGCEELPTLQRWSALAREVEGVAALFEMEPAGGH